MVYYYGNEQRNIASELNSLKRNLQMKRAMGYGLTSRDIAQLDYLTAKQEEMERLQRNREKRKRAEASRATMFPKKLTVEDVVSVFRMFDTDKDDMLDGEDFLSLVSSLLHVRDGTAPTPNKTLSVAKTLAKTMVYQRQWGIQRSSEGGISLSDFVYNAIHGDIGRFISDAHRSSRDVVGSLQTLQSLNKRASSVKNTNDKEIAPKTPAVEEQQQTSMNDTESSVDVDSSDEDVHECDEEEKEVVTKEEEEKADADDEVSDSNSDDDSDSDDDDDSDDDSDDSDDDAADSDNNDSESVTPNNNNNNNNNKDDASVSSSQHTLALGDMAIYCRPQDESCRTVKVVELLPTGDYAVEHEVETTAGHISLPDGVEGPIVKGSQVIYKKDFEARVIEVGSAYTYDEEGRPSYLIAVKTITDASRLSKESQQ